MAKYIGTYANSGDVQTALNEQELNRPFIAYTTDNEEVIFGAAADRAEAGDIVVYSTGDTLLHYIKQADYSASTYPAASYVPVGIVAYLQNDDAILGPSGEITFVGINWLHKNNPDYGSTGYAQNIEWGYSNFEIPELTNYANSGTAITDMNGKANTEIVLQYATAQTDWRTASAITFINEAGYYPLFECAWRYHTSGTVQGDWYIPSYGQMAQMYSIAEDDTNLPVLVNSGFVLLGQANKQYSIPNRATGYGTSTQKNNTHAFTRWSPNGSYTTDGQYDKSIPGYFRGHPFCSKLMTRI